MTTLTNSEGLMDGEGSIHIQKDSYIYIYICSEGLMDWRIDGLMDWWIEGLIYKWIDGLTDWRIDGLTDWRIDGYIYIYIYTHVYIYIYTYMYSEGLMDGEGDSDWDLGSE